MSRYAKSCFKPNKGTCWNLILDATAFAGSVLLIIAFIPPIVRPDSVNEDHASSSDYLRLIGMIILACSSATQYILTTKNRHLEACVMGLALFHHYWLPDLQV